MRVPCGETFAPASGFSRGLHHQCAGRYLIRGSVCHAQGVFSGGALILRAASSHLDAPMSASAARLCEALNQSTLDLHGNMTVGSADRMLLAAVGSKQGVVPKPIGPCGLGITQDDLRARGNRCRQHLHSSGRHPLLQSNGQRQQPYGLTRGDLSDAGVISSPVLSLTM